MATEVFNNIGEAELYSENQGSYKRHWQENDEPEPASKVEHQSKPLSDAKKEFLEQLNDDSLTIDTCSKLNHDWKKK